MFENWIKVWKTQRIHLNAPDLNAIHKLNELYDFHELVFEDLLELSAEQKIDVYDDHMFVVLHFPKYSTGAQKYLVNEFDIILGKNYLITISRFESSNLENFMKEFQQNILVDKKKSHVTPSVLLYDIIEVMYDKTLKSLNLDGKEVFLLQETIIDSKKLTKEVIEKLMNKKLNMIFLKHNFGPQSEIMKDLGDALNKFYKSDISEYMYDLEVKVGKINNNIAILYESLRSMTDTYNSLMNIEINRVITVLTIFTAIMWAVNLVAGIFGMNVWLPFQSYPYIFFIIIGIMVSIGCIMLFFFKRRGWL